VNQIQCGQGAELLADYRGVETSDNVGGPESVDGTEKAERVDRVELASRLRQAVARLRSAGWLKAGDVDTLLERADTLAGDDRQTVPTGGR
jgi:hypothetical protein